MRRAVAIVSVLGMTSAANASPMRAGVFVGDPVALTLAVDAGSNWSIEGGLGVSPGPVRGAVMMLGLSRDLMAPVLELGGGGVRPTLGLGLRLALTRVSSSTDEAEVLAGVRAPVGLAWRRDGMELFVEASPGVDFGERPRMSLEGGFGVRLEL